jgi:hypothetical protein
VSLFRLGGIKWGDQDGARNGQLLCAYYGKQHTCFRLAYLSSTLIQHMVKGPDGSCDSSNRYIDRSMHRYLCSVGNNIQAESGERSRQTNTPILRNMNEAKCYPVNSFFRLGALLICLIFWWVFSIQVFFCFFLFGR